ncbi:MAG: hypothetical protein ABSB58_10725 [Gemmatimonadales bacterium]
MKQPKPLAVFLRVAAPSKSLRARLSQAGYCVVLVDSLEDIRVVQPIVLGLGDGTTNELERACIEVLGAASDSRSMYGNELRALVAQKLLGRAAARIAASGGPDASR